MAFRTNRTRNAKNGLSARTLAFENLEERRVLATFSVGQIEIDTTIQTTLPGDPTLRHSLRSAIIAANDETTNPGLDTVIIPEQFDNETISLTLGTLEITSPINIVGPSDRIIIDRDTAPLEEVYCLHYNYSGSFSGTVELSGLWISGFTTGIKVDNMPADQPLVIRDSTVFGGTISEDLTGGHGIDFTSPNLLQLENVDVESNARYGLYVHDVTSTQQIQFINRSVARANQEGGIVFENSNRPFFISGEAGMTNNDTQTRQNGRISQRGGIWIESSSSTLPSFIGTGDADTGHISRGNFGPGIAIVGSNFPNLSIASNFVGVRRDDPASDGNTSTGIFVVDSTINTIGGNQVGANGGNGIEIRDSSVILATQNRIGTNEQLIVGGFQHGNDGAGLVVSGNTQNMIVSNNTIAFNGAAGIAVTDTSDRVTIFNNLQAQNGGLAVDLGLDGPTDNDPNDGDSGPNNLLNKPELLQSGVSQNGNGQWVVTVSLDVDAIGLYDFEFYRFDPDTNSVAPLTFAIGANVQTLNPTPGEYDAEIPITFEPSVGTENDIIVVAMTGSTGANNNRTTEFSNLVTLTSIPTLVGDFNADNVVDSIDYAVWREAYLDFVSPGTGADANGDGQVTGADFAFWKANYGATLSGTGSKQAFVLGDFNEDGIVDSDVFLFGSRVTDRRPICGLMAMAMALLDSEISIFGRKTLA